MPFNRCYTVEAVTRTLYSCFAKKQEGLSKIYLCGWITNKPALVRQSAETSQQTGWPCVASHMNTKMTHQLSSIFNSMDASLSSVPVPSEQAVGEKWRETQVSNTGDMQLL